MDNINTIIWDLDNTLYKFSEKQVDGWNTATVNYALASGLALDYQTAMALASEGWLNHRNSGHFFEKDHGLNAREMHVGVCKALCPTMVSSCLQTPSLMKNIPHVRNIILTFATRDWALRVLDHTGLAEFFEPELILGADDYDFQDKAHSALGILTALEKSGANPAQTLFVEDTLPNLKPAKDQAQVQTAYLHHNRPMDGLDTSFVDIIVQDTPQLLTELRHKKAA